MPIASPVFLKKKKKQFPDIQRELDNQVNMILKNPLLGDPKKGALQGIRVLKFKYKERLFLLSYEADFKKKVLYLYTFGSHEGFYEELERYIKAK
ncbi:MAG TPA: type II toxin-antitoxin system RelE/ParE family toxin [Thermodesulfovibrionales bacterium]|nr:type II toxin-antitoxin system RelE/ParE family toxin [Thermodesulfovibrionales bacterium]